MSAGSRVARHHLEERGGPGRAPESGREGAGAQCRARAGGREERRRVCARRLKERGVQGRARGSTGVKRNAGSRARVQEGGNRGAGSRACTSDGWRKEGRAHSVNVCRDEGRGIERPSAGGREVRRGLCAHAPVGGKRGGSSACVCQWEARGKRQEVARACAAARESPHLSCLLLTRAPMTLCPCSLQPAFARAPRIDNERQQVACLFVQAPRIGVH